MAAVKTAISLQKTLFDRAEALARRMKISRSRLVALALDDFLRRRRSIELEASINAAYDDTPDTAQKALRRRMRSRHRQVVEGEW